MPLSLLDKSQVLARLCGIPMIFLMKRLLLVISALVVSSSPAIAWEPGDDWRDDQCDSVLDDANRWPRYVGGCSIEAICFWVFTGWMVLKL